MLNSHFWNLSKHHNRLRGNNKSTGLQPQTQHDIETSRLANLTVKLQLYWRLCASTQNINGTATTDALSLTLCLAAVTLMFWVSVTSRAYHCSFASTCPDGKSRLRWGQIAHMTVNLQTCCGMLPPPKRNISLLKTLKPYNCNGLSASPPN